MEISDQILENEEKIMDLLRQLIASGRLSEKEAGIAKQALEKGIKSLSEKQRYVLEKAIENNIVQKCKQCGGDIPLDEGLEASENGGLCSDCIHFNCIYSSIAWLGGLFDV